MRRKYIESIVLNSMISNGVNLLRVLATCGSPPGVIVADTLSFNAKMDLVDF